VNSGNGGCFFEKILMAKLQFQLKFCYKEKGRAKIDDKTERFMKEP